MNTYRVGQVLFVVLRKEAKVYPMQCVEQITKRTLAGEEIIYMVKGGPGADSTLPISDIDGEVFDSSEKARRTLIERASVSIAQRIDHAVAKAKEWYPTGFEESSDDPLLSLRKPTSPPPKPNGGRFQKKPLNSAVAELAAEMKQEAEAADADIIELADGTRAKVASIKLPEALQR